MIHIFLLQETFTCRLYFRLYVTAVNYTCSRSERRQDLILKLSGSRLMAVLKYFA